MDDSSHSNEQSLIDRGAFEAFGKMSYVKGDKRPGRSRFMDWEDTTLNVTVNRKTFEEVQRESWNAALRWERESPSSLSNKRIKELNKVLGE